MLDAVVVAVAWGVEVPVWPAAPADVLDVAGADVAGVAGVELDGGADCWAGAEVVAWVVVVAGPELCELLPPPPDPPIGSMYC